MTMEPDQLGKILDEDGVHEEYFIGCDAGVSFKSSINLDKDYRSRQSPICKGRMQAVF
jgi:hypothetical protein